MLSPEQLKKWREYKGRIDARVKDLEDANERCQMDWAIDWTVGKFGSDRSKWPEGWTVVCPDGVARKVR